jgi:hypothetical protein
MLTTRPCTDFKAGDVATHCEGYTGAHKDYCTGTINGKRGQFQANFFELIVVDESNQDFTLVDEQALVKFREQAVDGCLLHIPAKANGSMTRYGLARETLVEGNPDSSVQLAVGFARNATITKPKVGLLVSGIVFDTSNPPRKDMSALSPIMGGSQVAQSWYVPALLPGFKLPPLIEGNLDYEALAKIVVWICLESKGMQLDVSTLKVRNIDSVQWKEAVKVLDRATLKKLFSVRDAVASRLTKEPKAGGRLSPRKRKLPANQKSVEVDDDEEEDDEEHDIDELVGKRIKKRKTEYLVSWSDFEEKSWEPVGALPKDMVRAYEDSMASEVVGNRVECVLFCSGPTL